LHGKLEIFAQLGVVQRPGNITMESGLIHISKIPNHKHQITNKSQIQKINVQNVCPPEADRISVIGICLIFVIWDLLF